MKTTDDNKPAITIPDEDMPEVGCVFDRVCRTLFDEELAAVQARIKEIEHKVTSVLDKMESGGDAGMAELSEHVSSTGIVNDVAYIYLSPTARIACQTTFEVSVPITSVDVEIKPLGEDWTHIRSAEYDEAGLLWLFCEHVVGEALPSR